MFRNRLDEIQAQTDAEKEWWEKRKGSISIESTKELDGPQSPAKVSTTATAE